MIDCVAKFTANNVKVEAKLSSGEIVEVYTSLTTSGHYKSWWEYPCEPQHGSVQYCEQDIDNDDISALYSDEWEFADTNKKEYQDENPNAFEDIKIVEIIRVIDTPDWQVDEDSLE